MPEDCAGQFSSAYLGLQGHSSVAPLPSQICTSEAHEERKLSWLLVQALVGRMLDL